MADQNSGVSETEVARRRWPARRRDGATPVTPAADPNDIPAEPEPEAVPPAAEQSSLITLAPVRLAALGVALVLVLLITYVKLFHTGPPSIDDLRAAAGVDNWTTLSVGVKDDQPGIGYHDAKTGIWSGFDIDIAYMIAEDLGFRRSEVRFYAIESEDRLRMQAVDAHRARVPVQMVIASYSITPDRQAEGALYSAPYLSTEQSVVTLAAHAKVSTLGDLYGKAVCTLSTSTSIPAPQRAGAHVVLRNKVSECFDELYHHRVDAVSTDAAILAGFKARDPDHLAHWDLGLEQSENYGVNLGANKALRELVNVTLYRSLHDPADHRWEDAYQRNLQVEVAQNGATPIAVAQQPDVPRPHVRELPWDRSYP